MHKKNIHIELEKRYVKFLIRRAKMLKKTLGPKYLKDKLSRFRRLVNDFPLLPYENINDRNFLDIIDTLNEKIPAKITAGGKSYHGGKDYAVIIRQLYEMNTNKSAPVYTHYRGVRISKYR